MIGIYQSDLNPPLGLPAGGHDPPPIMDGFYDRLYVKSISLSDNNTRILIASVDVVGVGRELCDQLRDEISNAHGIPMENIIILATHVHSAPETNCWQVRWFKKRDVEKRIEEFQRRLKKSIQWSMIQAMNNERRVKSLSFSSTKINDLYTNRNDPTKKIDNTISSLFVKTDENRGNCLIFNQHNHPTILGLGNTKYSADFPGAITRKISQIENIDQSNCITGACGDVSIRQILGDEFSSGRTYQNVIKYGNIIGEAIIESLSKPEDEIGGDLKLSARSKKVKLNLKSGPNREETLDLMRDMSRHIQNRSQNLVEKRKSELALYGLKMWAQTLDVNQGVLPDMIEMEFGAVYLGDDKKFVLAWVPGEILSETGITLKESSAYKHTFLSGYGNGYLGYFATPEAYRNLEYEANFTPISQESYPKIERTVKDLTCK
jgi:neutral ceramidase